MLVVAASLAAGCGDSGPKDYELTQDLVRAREGICRSLLPFHLRGARPAGVRTLDDIAYASLRGDVVMEVLEKQNRREPTPQQYELLQGACMRGFRAAIRELRSKQPDGYRAGVGECENYLSLWRSNEGVGLPQTHANLVGFDPADPLGSAVNVRMYWVEPVACSSSFPSNGSMRSRSCWTPPTERAVGGLSGETASILRTTSSRSRRRSRGGSSSRSGSSDWRPRGRRGSAGSGSPAGDGAHASRIALIRLAP